MFFIVDLYGTKNPLLGQKTSFGVLINPSFKAENGCYYLLEASSFAAAIKCTNNGAGCSTVLFNSG